MNVVAPALHILKYRAYMTAFFQVQTFRLCKSSQRFVITTTMNKTNHLEERSHRPDFFDSAYPNSTQQNSHEGWWIRTLNTCPVTSPLLPIGVDVNDVEVTSPLSLLACVSQVSSISCRDPLLKRSRQSQYELDMRHLICNLLSYSSYFSEPCKQGAHLRLIYLLAMVVSQLSCNVSDNTHEIVVRRPIYIALSNPQ